MAALFAAMAVLAAVPSVSVLTVTARAASLGFVHGAFTALGVVAGDLLFILLALFGLALLVEALDGLFGLVRLLGGACLIGLGVALWRSGTGRAAGAQAVGASLPASFLTGLLVTLADQKAVLFYFGLLPAFVSLDALTRLDVAAVSATAILAVGGVKLGYAYAAHRAGLLIGAGAGRAMNRAAAGLLFATGLFVILSP